MAGTETDAEQLTVLLGDWAGPDGRNLTDRLTLALRHLIDAGVLAAGTHLPPERTLATALAISRPTVSTVMAELRRLGLVESRQGSGTRVSAPADGAAAATEPLFFELAHTPSGVINLAGAMAFDASHLGDLSFGTADLLAVSPPDGLDPRGLATLRSAIADRYRPTGAIATDAEVVITSGAHQALALAVTALVPNGGRIVVEEHTYGGLADLAAANRAALIGVSRDDFGVDPDHLDRTLGRYRPDLVVLVANLHSPSGRLTPPGRLDELATVLDRHGIATVADNTYDELVYGSLPPGLAVRVRSAPLISVGTLSKAAWSGLRIGWLATEPTTADRITRLRTARFDFGPSVAAQVVAQRVLDQFEPMITARRARLAATATNVRRWIEAEVPAWSVVEPDGGLTLWARLPGNDSRPFVDHLRHRGVAVLAGTNSRADRGPDRHVRVCFDRPAHMLEAGLDRIRHTWQHP